MITTQRLCGYFRRRDDNSTWAMLLIDGKPSRAVAIESPFKEHPSEYNLRTGIKVRDWNLSDFERIGELFNNVGYRGPVITPFPSRFDTSPDATEQS